MCCSWWRCGTPAPSSPTSIVRAVAARRVVVGDRAAACRRPRSAPTGTAGRRPGTRAPCCGGSSGPGRPRRRTPAGASAPRRPPARPPRSRWRSHEVSAAVPSRSVAAAPCSSWPTWRRSVRRRSPSATDRTRPGSRSIKRDRLGQATPGRAAAAPPPRRAAAGGRPPTPRRRRPRRRSAVQPRNEVIVAACARTVEAGRSSASSSRSHSRAAGVANTLPAPLMTAGTPTRVQRVADQRRVPVVDGPSDPGGSARRRDAARSTRPRQQPDEIGGQVAARRTPARSSAPRSPCAVGSIAGSERSTTRTRSGAPVDDASRPHGLAPPAPVR